MQIPPTPTPFPESFNAPLEIPELSLWDYAPQAVQSWNTASEITTVFQALLLVGVVIFILLAIYRRVQKTTSNEG